MKNSIGLFVVSMTLSLMSCSMDSVVDEMSVEKVTSVESVEAKTGRTVMVDDILDNDWPVQAFSSCSFEIRNEEPSLYLEVCGMSIDNLYRSGTMAEDEDGSYIWTSLSERGEVSVPMDKVSLNSGESVKVAFDGYLIPQNVPAWEANCYPKMQTGSYIWLDCAIYNVCDIDAGYREGLDVPIWSDGKGGSRKVAIPVSLDLKPGQTQEIVLALSGDKHWYNVDDGYPSPVLTPIIFDVTVDGWNEGEEKDI